MEAVKLVNVSTRVTRPRSWCWTIRVAYIFIFISLMHIIRRAFVLTPPKSPRTTNPRVSLWPASAMKSKAEVAPAFKECVNMSKV